MPKLAFLSLGIMGALVSGDFYRAVKDSLAIMASGERAVFGKAAKTEA